ncbi:MAG: hypothetical protein DLM50_07060 [Candidatus Meridianibacter frigidus]|nr:MAG: hypothetical protein DLM50_07060 [Candidatus Eremiobacteraeota bacterium]
MKILSAFFAIALLGTSVASAKTPAKAAHAHKQMHQLVQIKVDLDFKPHKRSSFGKLLGYDPVEVHVHQNDQIQFVNVDDAAHTATGMSYTGQTAPAHYQFQGDPTKTSGRLINATEWSTGNLRAHGGKSQVFIAKNVGHYFYACSYHLSQGQIGVIVVGP